MRLLIIGATGFIGREVVKEMQQAGHKVMAVSRNVQNAREILGALTEIAAWDGLSATTLSGYITGTDAIINLAGENLSSGRWTKRRKQIISDSRIKTGRILSKAVNMAASKPAVLVQGSAIGYYGSNLNEPAVETQPAGTGYLASLTGEWENSVMELENIIPRIVIVRSGLVLGKNGGLLDKMLIPFKFYSGAIIGSGQQWMSWIHIRDEVRAIRFLAENANSAGPYNLTTPDPVKMKEFIAFISKITGKPAWLKIPEFLLTAFLGEMAQQTALASQNVYPGKLLNEGFQFEYPVMEQALKDILT